MRAATVVDLAADTAEVALADRSIMVKACIVRGKA
jgi:hypothetical protein